jgi:cytidyltransferase-like protein
MYNTRQLFEDLNSNRLVKKFGLHVSDLRDCWLRYGEPHRFYHSYSHIFDLFDQIEQCTHAGDKEMIQLIALYHDSIYDPQSQTNEADSANYFRDSMNPAMINDDDCTQIIDAIMDTKYSFPMNDPSSDESSQFIDFDFNQLYTNSVEQLISNEYKIMKEYQYLPFTQYKKNRLEFIDNVVKVVPFDHGCENLVELKHFIENWRPKIGIYAGSFNPFTTGHMNILEQAERLFDKVIILQPINPDKPVHNYNVSNTLPCHQIIRWGRMVMEYVTVASTHCDITLVRGLRNGNDLQYEENMKRFMGDQGDCNVAYFLSDMEFQHISRSDVRGIKKFDANMYNSYIPTKYTYLLENK